MTWVRLDDQFADHPKVVALGVHMPSGVGLFVSALCYASRYLTDGFIPTAMVPRLLPGGPRGTLALAERLVSVGLWEREANGFRIHDYLSYNPSRESVEERRRQKSDAGSKGAASRWQNAMPPPSHHRGERSAPEPDPDPSRARPDPADEAIDATDDPILDAYSAYYPRPTANALKALDKLAEQYGPGRVAAALAEAGARTGRDDLISNARATLVRQSREAERAEKVDEARRNAEKRARVVLRPPPIESASPEEVAAELAAYRAEVGVPA